ncbi:hypothetical protein [Micromonospora tulbaghiae]
MSRAAQQLCNVLVTPILTVTLFGTEDVVRLAIGQANTRLQ